VFAEPSIVSRYQGIALVPMVLGLRSDTCPYLLDGWLRHPVRRHSERRVRRLLHRDGLRDARPNALPQERVFDADVGGGSFAIIDGSATSHRWSRWRNRLIQPRLITRFIVGSPRLNSVLKKETMRRRAPMRWLLAFAIRPLRPAPKDPAGPLPISRS
jgi:hypothetical protein